MPLLRLEEQSMEQLEVMKGLLELAQTHGKTLENIIKIIHDLKERIERLEANRDN